LPIVEGALLVVSLIIVLFVIMASPFFRASYLAIALCRSSGRKARKATG